MANVKTIEGILKDRSKARKLGDAILAQHHYRGVTSEIEMNSSKQIIIHFHNRTGDWIEIFNAVRDVDQSVVEKL